MGALIDTLPNAVCLNTPPWQAAFARNPVESLPFCKWLMGDFALARQQLREGVLIKDIRAADGRPLMDGAKDPGMTLGDDGQPKAVSFSRPSLPESFTLAMRQTTLFTSVLPTLAQFKHFRVVAVIRNPVALGLSWQKLPQPLLSPGNPPGIARWWPEALEALKGSMAEQFAQLYELHVQRYHEAGATVLRHEDVVADPGMISRMFGQEALPSAAAYLRPPSPQVDTAFARELRTALRHMGVFSKLYYPDL